MNRYFQEVLDAHEFIRRWLGEATTQNHVCDDLLARFSPDFTMVSTAGSLLDFDALNRFFRTQRGVRKGLTLDIMDMQMVAESERGATVCYKEQQHVPGQNTTLRFSTVVFELNEQGKVRWRHLHETALPLG
jgi:hypothetical protein